MISEKRIFLDVDVERQYDAFVFAADQAKTLGIANNTQAVFKALKAREEEGSTGLENGFAIPHAKSKAIKEAAILILRFKKPVVDKHWKTLDDLPIQVGVFLLVPEEKVSKTHINLLSKVSQLLLEDEVCTILKNGNKKEIIKALTVEKKTYVPSSKPSKETQQNGTKLKNKTIVGVSSCPAGLAHTYLAAKALVKAGEKIGAKVKIETRGTTGIDDEISISDLEGADAVIFASDVRVDQNKFVGKRFYSCSTKDAIKDPLGSLALALKSKSFVVGEGRKFNGNRPLDKVMRWSHDTFSEPFWLALLLIAFTGIAYGILYAFQTYQGTSNDFLRVLLGGEFSIGDRTVSGSNISGFFAASGGFGIIQIATAIFAGFIGYRIGGRPGFGVALVAGFFTSAGGAAAANGEAVINFYNPYAAVFGNGIQLVLIWPLYGALIGVLGGLFAKYIYLGIKKTKLNGFLKTLVLFLALPFVTALNIFISNYMIVYPLFIIINPILQGVIISGTTLAQWFTMELWWLVLSLGIIAAIPCVYFAFKNPVVESFIKETSEKIKNKREKKGAKHYLNATYKYFMSGISFFLVVLTATSLLWGAVGLLAIPTIRGAFPPFLTELLETLFSRAGGFTTDGTWTSYTTAGLITQLINNVGFSTFTLVTIILGSFIAYSIGGIVAFMPALIMATLGNDTSGFLGAVVSGFLIGFLIRYLYIVVLKIRNRIRKNPKWWKWSVFVFASYWIIPVIGFLSLLVGTFLINGIIGIVNEIVVGGIQNFQGLSIGGTEGIFNINGNFIVGLIIGAMICFDLGGPINKIAVAAALAIRGNNIYTPGTEELFVPLAAQAAAISVVPLGLWFSTLIFRKKYSKQEHLIVESGATLGWVGISEGAIPMLAKDPFRMIPVNVIGGAIAGGLAGGFGLGAVATINSPIGIFVGVIQPLEFPVYPFAWLLTTFAGIFWVAIVYALVKKRVPKEEKDVVIKEFRERKMERKEKWDKVFKKKKPALV